MNEEPVDRYLRKVDELAKKFVAGKITAEQYNEQTKRLHDGLKETGEAHTSAFGSKSIEELSSYAAGALSIGKAIEFVTEALHSQAEEKRRAAENVAGGLQGIDSVVNSNNPQQAAGIAEQFMNAGLIPRNQQGTAFGVGGQIVQSGFGNESAFLQELAEKRVIQPGQAGELSQSIAKIAHGFGPSAGSFEDLAKKLRVAASEPGVGASVSDIGRYIADVSKEATDSGMSVDQVIAAYATYAQQTKSPKSGEAKLKEMLKDGGGFEGTSQADFENNLRDVTGAPGKAIPDYIASNRLRSGARAGEKAQGKLQSSIEQKVTERQQLYDLIGSEQEKWEIDHGFGGFHRALGRAARSTFGIFDSSQDAAISAAVNDSQYRDQITPETRGRIEDYLKRQTELMEQNSRSLPPPSGLQE